ncbi:MAG: hypothetical protein ABR962_01475 [Candidatus Bathyarchaeia archaeon]
MIKTSDGGYALAGYTRSYGAGGSDMWLLKDTPYCDAMGDITPSYPSAQWNEIYGGAQDDVAKCVIQTSDGGYALAGYTNSSGAGGTDMWLVKTDSNGAMQWNATYGGLLDDGANSIIQTNDGGYLLAGYVNSSDGAGQSTWLVKTDSAGNMIWTQTLPGQGANSAVQTSDGGYALATAYSNAFGLVKVNSIGNIQWNQTYAGPSDEAMPQSVIKTGDGGYALAGWTMTNSTGSRGAWLVKTDSSGNIMWSQTYPGLGVYSLIQTSDGNYAMTGDRACLLITDPSGSILWNEIYDSVTEPQKWFTRAYSLVEMSLDNFAMAGASNTFSNGGLDVDLTTVTLKTDITPPTITVLSPENKTYVSSNVPLAFYSNQPVQWMGYAIDNGLNATITGNTTLPQLPDGFHNITVYATDPAFNTGSSNTVYFGSFGVDTVPVDVSIQSTQNSTFNTNSVLLNFTINKPVSWAAYSLDGQINTITSQNITLTGLTAGTHTLTIYAADALGLVGASNTLSFTVANNQIPEFPSTGILASILAITLIVSSALAMLRKKGTKNPTLRA